MDDTENGNSHIPLKSSDELMYSEYTGTTVAEHVLESLEKTTTVTRSEKINMFLETKKKSASLARVRKLISLMDENPETSVLEASTDDKEAIDVIMDIGENSSNTNSNIDAWFILNHSNGKDLEYSYDECMQNPSTYTQSNILDVEDDSSDSSDSECDQNVFVSERKKSLLNIVEDDCSEISDNECPPNASVSLQEKNLCDTAEKSSDHSENEYKSRHSVFPKQKKSTNFEENGTSNLSDKEYEQRIFSTLKNSNFVKDNSSENFVVGSKKSISVSEAEKITASNGVFSELSDIKNLISVPTEKKRKLISVIEDESSDIHDSDCPQKKFLLEKKMR